MRIEALYRTDVVTAEPHETLQDAARRMEWMEIGSLPVCEAGRLVGIVTERDITRAVAAAEPIDTPVARYMSAAVLCAHPGEDTTEVAKRMLDMGVRHLPVVKDGEIVGIVSARDLLAMAAW